MSPPPPAQTPADARHWRLSRRLAGLLLAVWLLLCFVPLWFARDLGFEFFGAPFVIWLCSQGAPLVFVLLAWRYERGMDRLDREHRAGRAD